VRNLTVLKRFVRLQNETPRKREVFFLIGDTGDTGGMVAGQAWRVTLFVVKASGGEGAGEAPKGSPS
jgi:hypothetical protein